MTDPSPVITLSPQDSDAVLFDLDGVLTTTARAHAAAWKRLFDRFLERLALAGRPMLAAGELEVTAAVAAERRARRAA